MCASRLVSTLGPPPVTLQRPLTFPSDNQFIGYPACCPCATAHIHNTAATRKFSNDASISYHLAAARDIERTRTAIADVKVTLRTLRRQSRGPGATANCDCATATLNETDIGGSRRPERRRILFLPRVISSVPVPL